MQLDVFKKQCTLDSVIHTKFMLLYAFKKLIAQLRKHAIIKFLKNETIIGGEIMPAIKINISIEDGLYMATSDDLPGLFVADKNIIDLFNEIPAVIKALYKESVGKGANQWSTLLI